MLAGLFSLCFYEAGRACGAGRRAGGDGGPWGPGQRGPLNRRSLHRPCFYSLHLARAAACLNCFFRFNTGFQDGGGLK